MNWKPRDPENRGAPCHPGTASSGSSGREARQADCIAEAIGSVERPGTRVFVGVKVAPEIARDLATIARSLEAYPVRLVRPADIHLTLVPPWNEMNIAGAVETLRTAVRPFGSVDLVFEHAQYGPTLERPRLLWIECAVTPELVELQKQLVAAFGQTNERPFLPHITLVRIPKNARMIAEKNPIDQQLSHTQRVRSIDLFQSPKRADEGYQVIASLPLGETVERASSAEPG